jgi:hypothetical protein
MTFMVIERFRNGDAAPVYARFRERGRLAPDGVKYITSWVDESFQVCFQVMEADSRSLLDEWIANWGDLVNFEVFPVVDSATAQARFSS